MNTYPENILEQLQATLLDMLDIIARICERNGIEWFLTGGSALGAVRHGAMIPWDDDIDIGMLRPDYERFLEAAENELPSEYSLQIPQTTDNYAPMFAKVCKTNSRFLTQELVDAGLLQGIAIDIFPHDAVSADPTTRKAQYRNARNYTRMSYLYHSRHISRQFTGIAKPLSAAAFTIAHAALQLTTDERKLRAKFEDGTRIGDDEPICGYTTFGHPYFKPLPKEVFVPATLKEFAGKMRPVPGQYETYLADHYGENWKELPPPDKRKTHAPLVLDFGDGTNVLG